LRHLPLFLTTLLRPPRPTLFPYTTLFRSQTLFGRNHLPVLREEIKSGRVVSVKTFVPSYHGDGRADWTFAVQIVFKDDAALSAPDRKSTRPNSSHRTTSNAASCLKKKKKK